jgi:heat-inducible transcriptional repressor
MVDDRRAVILRAVVKEYIETSQPVSSTSVVESHEVAASPATVRSEMAALEREGYLQQPHTSAGRIPTDRGYRFFVDNLDMPGRLGRTQQEDVRSFFDKTSGELERMLHETSGLLTNLTGAAALVVGPDHETTTVRSVQLVGLSARTAIAVVVFSNGSVEKRTLDLPHGTDDDSVSAAGIALTRHLDGKALHSARSAPETGNAAVDALAEKALLALQDQHNDDGEQVYVGGASRLASAFDAVEVISSVLTILEQQYVVVNLIRDLLDRGVSVSIGAENQLQPLAHCSLIVAPTVVDGESRGCIAVLGPTRMDYARTMAAVSVVSKQLGDRLGDA